jgi:hypothetical protein
MVRVGLILLVSGAIHAALRLNIGNHPSHRKQEILSRLPERQMK